MNERLKERIQNFAEIGAEVNQPIRRAPPFIASDKGFQLMPDIRRDGLIPPRREGMQTLPDINRDGLEPDYSGAMQLMKQIEDAGGRVSEGERRLFMNMSPEELKNMNMDFSRGVVDDAKGAISNREMELFERLSPSYDVDIDGRDFQFEGDGGLDLMGLRQRLGLEPMYDATGTRFDEVMVMPEAEALSQMGRGKDTLLGHLEAGDVVVPPDVLENDPMLADVLEERMMMAGVDPASRVAGLGIASLNPNTGLEEFGLFKSIKKVVKKVAPYAGIIAAPFTGGLSAALIGAGGGLLSGKGLKGAALGALGGFGANAALGKLGLTASAVKGAGGLMPALKGAGAKIAGGLKGLKGLGSLGGLGGAISGAQGGRGGMGLGSLLGAGIPAALLAKKAYDEAKADKGIQLTPMNQFDSLGRFNIEAEIARRTGKERPNPVEFGLLPELPELSGGKPIQRAAYGGPVMAFAEGGDVAMEDFRRMTRDINGAGTETSDDIPAMLSDGEFVMTARSVRGAGAFDMNNDGGIITLVPSMSEDRTRGTELMNQMMDMFSSQATPS
tara:strand:- start:1323 stop:2993 length:1671 start_codon:yes stop_codon:yes gene_type:complete